MFEYVAFNPFNSSPEALANELTKKSAEGWEVVDIVTTFDGRYCAFLRRPVVGATTSAAAPATSVSAAPATSGAAPAAWYAAPSGRFELRYWDGGQWTEHVSRAGQQYTDPPVA